MLLLQLHSAEATPMAPSEVIGDDHVVQDVQDVALWSEPAAEMLRSTRDA